MLKTMLILTLTLSVLGCSGGVVADKGLEALCQRTQADRTTHAAALADDGGVKSIMSGRMLIGKIDGGCEPYDKAAARN